MRVEFSRAPGYGDSKELDLDVVPRMGDDVHWDGRSHRVFSVV